MTRTANLVACLLLLGFSAGEVRAQNEDACRGELATRAPQLQESEAFCVALAGFIFSRLAEAEAEEILAPDPRDRAAIFSQRDLQSRSSQQTELAGTLGQGHAIPGVQPAAVAAGTIAAVGTRVGQEALAAFSVNPLTLFLAETASEELAKYSRLADVTTLIPISDVGVGGEDPSPPSRPTTRYIGIRVRFNFTGVSAGREIWDAADRLLRTRISRGARAVAGIASILVGTSDVAGCAAALLADDAASAVNNACGVPFEFEPDLALATELREELARVRRAADESYFGADLRIDFGDPTLGAVDGATGQFLFAGLAVGRRIGGSGATSLGFRARLGLRHAMLSAADRAEFAGEGGVGLEVSRRVDDYNDLSMSGAFEFRYGDAPAEFAEVLQTNFLMLRGSIRLPVTGSNSISINVGAPVWGDVAPAFSVNFNWSLLLSEQIAGS